MTALWRDAAKTNPAIRRMDLRSRPGTERYRARLAPPRTRKQYLDFIQQNMDHFVADDGSIRTYSLDDYNIDNILPGRNLLFLYKTTGNEKYRKAAAAPARTTENSPAHFRRRLLAQEDLPVADVARRSLHG